MSGARRWWRLKRLLSAVHLFTGIVWRQTANGSLMTIKHAWETAGVNERAKEFYRG